MAARQREMNCAALPSRSPFNRRRRRLPRGRALGLRTRIRYIEARTADRVVFNAGITTGAEAARSAFQNRSLSFRLGLTPFLILPRGCLARTQLRGSVRECTVSRVRNRLLGSCLVVCALNGTRMCVRGDTVRLPLELVPTADVSTLCVARVVCKAFSRYRSSMWMVECAMSRRAIVTDLLELTREREREHLFSRCTLPTVRYSVSCLPADLERTGCYLLLTGP